MRADVKGRNGRGTIVLLISEAPFTNLHGMGPSTQEVGQISMGPCEATDEGVRASLREGDVPGATRAALELYGPEVFGFLCGVVTDRDAAEKLYADVVQRITTEVVEFRWHCSLRTWTYWIARRELQDRRYRGPPEPARSSGHLEPVATESNRPAGTTALRSRLDERDREILILHVDRALGWQELAVTGIGEDAPIEAVAREAGRLKARFDRIVREIRQGVEDGRPAP